MLGSYQSQWRSGGVEISGDCQLDQGLAPLSSKTGEKSAVPLREGLIESLVQNPKVSEKCSFKLEGCTKTGEARPIDARAGSLHCPGSLEPFAMQDRVPYTWLKSRQKYFASTCELVFGGLKNPFVKTEQLRNEKLSRDRKDKKKPLSF